MSEYQYYEFLAIDRPLTPAQVEEVGQHSSRAEITSTRFVNEYNFGDFRGDPYEFLRKYFDVMVYYANWGTHRFMMRLPADVVDAGRVEQYCTSDVARLKRAGDNLIVDITATQEEYSAWEEGGQWTNEITPVRAAVLAGDDRPLYLAWLAGVQEMQMEESAPEPPVPPGLGRLTGPLKTFADFLWIEEDLLAAAAEASGVAGASADDGFANWLAHLPLAEKDRLLRVFCEGADPHLPAKLRRQFRETFAAASPRQGSGRTVGQLLKRAEEIRQEQERVDAERNAAERARRDAEAAREHERELAALAKRGEAAWQEVRTLIASKQPKGYEEAVKLLKDLRELAGKAGDGARFQSRLQAIREEHARKAKFIDQLNRAGLVPKAPPGVA
jgi:hypothetical protein